MDILIDMEIGGHPIGDVAYMHIAENCPPKHVLQHINDAIALLEKSRKEISEKMKRLGIED